MSVKPVRIARGQKQPSRAVGGGQMGGLRREVRGGGLRTERKFFAGPADRGEFRFVSFQQNRRNLQAWSARNLLPPGDRGARAGRFAWATGLRRFGRRVSAGAASGIKFTADDSALSDERLAGGLRTVTAFLRRFRLRAGAFGRGLRAASCAWRPRDESWGLDLATFLRRTVGRLRLADGGTAFAAVRRRGAFRFAPVPAWIRFTRATARFMTDYPLRLGGLFLSCNGNSQPEGCFFALDSGAGCG